MPISIPPAIKYPNPLASLPDYWQQDRPPVEGPRQIPVEILWGTMGGSGSQKCIAFNGYGGGQGSSNAFSRINALSVDNSACGCDVQFIFTDTSQTITIPAYSPYIVIPVFTNRVDFYVLTKGTVLSDDQTRFSVHNTLPPPIAVPTTQAQNVAATGAIDVTVGSTAIVTAGTNGTLENGNMQASCTVAGGGNFLMLFTLRDGDSNVLGRASWGSNNEDDLISNALIWNVQGVHLRFKNGLNLVQTAVAGAPAGAQSYLNVNLYYRTP